MTTKRKLPPLSKEAQEARKPSPPEELVGALQDRHVDKGVLVRAAKIVKVPRIACPDCGGLGYTIVDGYVGSEPVQDTEKCYFCDGTGTVSPLEALT